MTETLNRRNFIRAIGVAAIAGVAVGKICPVPPAFADVGAPLDSELPMAKALGYVHDASKADTEKRKLPEMKDRTCANCALYQEGGKKIQGQPGDWGKCGLFPQGLVAANGWCLSWAPKPI